jgi:hypothetical protein
MREVRGSQTDRRDDRREPPISIQRYVDRAPRGTRPLFQGPAFTEPFKKRGVVYLVVRPPSEGKGHTFESCRVRHEINSLTTYSSRCCGPWLPHGYQLRIGNQCFLIFE